MTWPDIVYVDRDDRILGHCQLPVAVEKQRIHRIARLFLFNSKGELLLQKRSAAVSVPDKWDQSAAGHVDAGQTYQTAAISEAAEEIGVTNITLQEVVKFYAEEQDEGIVRKRFNMLYEAVYDGEVTPNPSEVAAVRWVRPEELKVWIRDRPQDFTAGFLGAFRQYERTRGTIET